MWEDVDCGDSCGGGYQPPFQGSDR